MRNRGNRAWARMWHFDIGRSDQVFKPVGSIACSTISIVGCCRRWRSGVTDRRDVFGLSDIRGPSVVDEKLRLGPAVPAT